MWGRARQETGVVEAFIAGTRGWLRWNASRLISRNIIYRLSCPYVARTARYNTYKHVHTHTHTRSHDPSTIHLGDIDSFHGVFATHATTKTPRRILPRSRGRVSFIRGSRNHRFSPTVVHLRWIEPRVARHFPKLFPQTFTRASSSLSGFCRWIAERSKLPIRQKSL